MAVFCLRLESPEFLFSSHILVIQTSHLGGVRSLAYVGVFSFGTVKLKLFAKRPLNKVLNKHQNTKKNTTVFFLTRSQGYAVIVVKKSRECNKNCRLCGSFSVPVDSRAKKVCFCRTLGSRNHNKERKTERFFAFSPLIYF